MKAYLLTAVLLAALIALGGDPAHGQNNRPIDISAVELGWAYGVDEEAAINKYQGRMLRVSGQVIDIAMDDGRPRLRFKVIHLNRMANFTNYSLDEAKRVLDKLRYGSVAYYFDPHQADIIDEVLKMMFSEADYTVECELTKGGHSVDNRPGTCKMAF